MQRIHQSPYYPKDAILCGYPHSYVHDRLISIRRTAWIADKFEGW